LREGWIAITNKKKTYNFELRITRKFITLKFERVERGDEGHLIVIAKNNLGLEKREVTTRESFGLRVIAI
jgi:two-component sensor histidine kinase